MRGLQGHNSNCFKQINSVHTPMMNELSEFTHNISKISLHENTLSFSAETDTKDFTARLAARLTAIRGPHLDCLSILHQAVYLAPNCKQARVSCLVNSWLHFTFLSFGRLWSRDKKFKKRIMFPLGRHLAGGFEPSEAATLGTSEGKW